MPPRSSPGWWARGRTARSTCPPTGSTRCPPPTPRHHRRLRRRRPRSPGRRAGPRLAEATGARLRSPPSTRIPGSHSHRRSAAHVDERRRADRAIRAVRDELAPGTPTVVVPGLSPAHALCKLADERRARTIVVGSRHAVRGRHMGDADHGAAGAAGSANAAVLVAPDEHPVAPTLRRIVVGFDDDDGSRDALDWGIQLARSTGAHLHLASVVPYSMNSWWIAGATAVDPGALDRWHEATQQRARGRGPCGAVRLRRHRDVLRGPGGRPRPPAAGRGRRCRSARPRLAALGGAGASRARERLRAHRPPQCVPDARGPTRPPSERSRRRAATGRDGAELTE